MIESYNYFAYGSCMDADSLSCSLGVDCKKYMVDKAVLQNYALVFNYPSTVRTGGLCNIMPKSKSQVEGVLYRLPKNTIEQLDIREAQPKGRYYREYVHVNCSRGHAHKALVYIAAITMDKEVIPEDEYLDLFIRGMHKTNLSKTYKINIMTKVRALKKNQC